MGPVEKYLLMDLSVETDSRRQSIKMQKNLNRFLFPLNGKDDSFWVYDSASGLGIFKHGSYELWAFYTSALLSFELAPIIASDRRLYLCFRYT